MGQKHEHDLHDHEHHNHHHAQIGHHHERAFRYGVVLNILLVIAQIWASIQSHSVSLLADAWHNLGDVLSLILSWVALRLAARPTTERFTYGLKSSTVLAALFNSASLLFLTGGLLWESIRRFSTPETVNASLVIPFAALGILVNGLSAIPFFKSKDLNLRSAFLHLVADALISAGVLIAAFVQTKTDLVWIDPATSVAICLVIAWGSWAVLKEALSLSLYAVPKQLELAKIKAQILNHSSVEKIHDLHVWSIGTSDLALTCHLLLKKDAPQGNAMREIESLLLNDFGISHVTLQVEDASFFDACKQAPHTH